MSVKNKFRIGEGMLILAFAFAVQQYHAAAVLLAAAGLLTSVSCQQEGNILRLFPLILSSAIVQMALAHMTTLFRSVPETGILILCNTAAAFLFMTCDDKETESTVSILTGAMLIFTAMALVFPSALISYGDTAVLLGVIFLPAQFCFVFKKQVHLRHSRKLMEE